MTNPVDSQTRPVGNHEGQVYAGNNDRYKIVKKLGAGGMGQVCLGIAEKTSREVAVKFLHDELQEDSAASRERFEREIKVLLELQAFRGIVRIEDYGRTPGGSMFFVMEYLKSPTLDRVIEENPNGLPQIRAVQIALEILTILEPVHRRGFVHRDLKPQNISVTEDPLAVFLLDFGLSKPVYEGEGFKKVTKRIEGRGFETPGSPHYMAVEQFLRPKSIDNRTDLYAVGVILYELLSGQPPFRGIYVQDILRQHKESNAPVLDRAGDGSKISYRLQAVINRSLEKDQDKRFQDAGEFKEALFDILNMLNKMMRPKKVLDASYRILRKLGQGGNSEVFEAEKLDDGQRVAIKIAREGGGGQWDEETLMNEADRALSHENIVKVVEFGIFDSRPALIMEIMEGGTCEDLLKKYQETGIPEDVFYATIIDCCRGLHHAHIAGLIHRDVKPGNMLRDKAGRTKVCDFGIAKRMEKKGTGKEGVKATKMMGTALYMAPEMCGTEDAIIDRRADIYAMGVMMYEMLTGHPPFEDGVLILRQLQDDPPPLLVRGTYKNPDELAKIVEKCMMKEREKRFQSMKELAHELYRVSQLEPQKAPHKPVPLRTKPKLATGAQAELTTQVPVGGPKKKNTAVFAGVAVLVVAVVGFAAWKMMNPPPAPPVEPSSNPSQLQTVNPAVTKLRDLLSAPTVAWAEVKAVAKDLDDNERVSFRLRIFEVVADNFRTAPQSIGDIVAQNAAAAPAVDVLAFFAADKNVGTLWDDFVKAAQTLNDAAKSDKSVDRALLPWRDAEVKALGDARRALSTVFSNEGASLPGIATAIAAFQQQRSQANRDLLAQAIDEAFAKGKAPTIDIPRAFADLTAYVERVRGSDGDMAAAVDGELRNRRLEIKKSVVDGLSKKESMAAFSAAFATIAKENLGVADLTPVFAAVAAARKSPSEARASQPKTFAELPEAILAEFCSKAETRDFFPTQLAKALGAEPAEWSKNFASAANDLPAAFLGTFVGDAVVILTRSGANGLFAQSLQSLASKVASGEHQKTIDELKKRRDDFFAALAKDNIVVNDDTKRRINANWSELEREFVPSAVENDLAEVQRLIADSAGLAAATLGQLNALLKSARKQADDGATGLDAKAWQAIESALSTKRPLTLLRLAISGNDRNVRNSTRDKVVALLKSTLESTKVTRAQLLAGMPEGKREHLNLAWLNGEGLDTEENRTIRIDFAFPECELSELVAFRCANPDEGTVVSDAARPGVLSVRLVPKAVVKVAGGTNVTLSFALRLLNGDYDLKEDVALSLAVADLGSFDFVAPTLQTLANDATNGRWTLKVKVTDNAANPTLNALFRGKPLALSPVGTDGTYEAVVGLDQFDFADGAPNVVEVSAVDAHRNPATQPIRIDTDTMNGHRETLVRALIERLRVAMTGRFAANFASMAPETAFAQMGAVFDQLQGDLTPELDKWKTTTAVVSRLRLRAGDPLNEWSEAVKAAARTWQKPAAARDAAKAAWTALTEKVGAFEERCTGQRVGTAANLDVFVNPLWAEATVSNPNPSTGTNQGNTPIPQPPVRPTITYPDKIRVGGIDYVLLEGTGVGLKDPVWMSTVETSRSFARAAGLGNYLDRAKENSSQSNMGKGDGTFNDMTDAYPLCPLTVEQIRAFVTELGSSSAAQGLLPTIEGLGGRGLRFDLPTTGEWTIAATKMQAPGKEFSWEARGSSGAPSQFTSASADSKTPPKFKELQPVQSDPTANPFHYMSGNVSETCSSGVARGGEISDKGGVNSMKMSASNNSGSPSKFRGFRLVVRLVR